MPLPAGTRLGRYEVRSPLGAGGMGEVYLAWDCGLERNVALKVLPQDVASDQQRMNRFIQEARAASALNHPNILSIHDVGETDSTQFIVTEYVEGETLRQRLSTGRMDVREAISVATQVASALSEAHGAGIVHRDIKPENVMLRNDGVAKVLDFGIAKLAASRTPAADTEAPTRVVNTLPGTVLGTVSYMSPEQARGLEVDGRTDIWSLGVVLYEVVSGRVPFDGETATDVLATVLHREPQSLLLHRKDVPEELERIVEKALTKDREERYQLAKDLGGDLKRLRQRLDVEAETGGDLHTTSTTRYVNTAIRRHKRGVGLVLAVLVLMVIAVVANHLYSTRTDKGTDSIAVLPFMNSGGDANTEYLSDGISETLINSLTQLQQLRVVARHTAFRYKGKEIDPQVVGQELKVRAVLMGRVRQWGDALNIQVDLVDVRTGAQLWGTDYERKISEVLAVKQEIAREVTEHLRLRLSGEEQKQLVKRDTTDAEAYQLYLKGRFSWNKYTEEGFRKSIEYFKQAVEKDPAYALAHSGLADSYSLLGELSVAPPKESFPQARAYAEKALALDETLAEAHVSLAMVKLLYEWDWPGAEKELRRAKELDPNNPQVYHFYGHYLQSVGRLEEAIVETKRGVDLDPTSLVLNAELGWAYHCARHYDQAIAQGRRTLELDPNFVFTSWVIAQSYGQRGRYQEAIAELKRARKIETNWPYIIAELGYAYAVSGERSEAEKILQQLKERAAGEYIDASLVAYIYVGQGQKDQAFAWLEKAYQERSGLLPWLQGEPRWDPLRGDERFADLLRRLNLPQASAPTTTHVTAALRQAR